MSNGPSFPNGSDGLDLRAGRYGATIRGRDTIIIVLLSAALGAFIYVDYRGQLDRQSEHETMLRELRIQTWLQSLPVEKRPRMIMPSEAIGRVLVWPRDSATRDDVDRGIVR